MWPDWYGSLANVKTPMQNHFIAGDVRGPKATRAYWAIKPQGTAIIFVHGWKGQAVGTWSVFERMLSADTKCRGCDLVFYSYDSLKQPTLISAGDLYKYLKRLFIEPSSVVNKDVRWGFERGSSFQFSRVLLVAHSLGAVICRQALLRAYKTGDKWPEKTELVLFAPAHLGSTNIHSFVTEVAGLLKIPLAVAAAEFWWPTINELKEKSITLTALENQTAKALASGKADYLRAKKVFFGKKERIVTVGDFCEDEPFDSDLFPGKGHVAVCKPRDGFRTPFEEILKLL
jgi:hypothetical protein